ncbi:MAG TPA: hypothetical protein VGU74_14560 [Gemmatimonadales bacterium]|nr:hypothetical protein [Gemmatimonadales bacterium]
MRASRWVLLVVVGTLAWINAASAQVQSVDAGGGGRTFSLGQPPRQHWQLGVGAGAYLRGDANDVLIRASAGVYTAKLNPVAKLVELGFETYLGARGSRADAGVRTVFQVPYLSSGIAADYSLTAGRMDMLITAHTPVRRGGIFTRGTMLRFDWYPLLGHTFTLGVTAPIHDRLAGRNRPLQDFVVVTHNYYLPETAPPTTAALGATLDSVAASAQWIRRLVAPFLDQDGHSDAVAVGRTQRSLAELQAHLAVRSVDQEIRFFHRELARVFAIAADDSLTGERLAAEARRILLDQIILPYDRLLGRKKRHDTLREYAMAARGAFSRSVASGTVPVDRIPVVMFAFQRVTEFLDDVRQRAAVEWDDPRLVWLPLQYGLLPEQYDEQRELDDLLERATNVSFTTNNRVSYVTNMQFHWELLRMIRETRDYHVLWIHDFPAITNDALDGAALTQVVDGYLTALAERVEAYDSAGTLPSYFIFLDQHYYEERQSRILMTLLEDPLSASSRLAHASPDQTTQLARALDRLHAAVVHSRVLQAEARQYGDAWLHNRIKVHINITNRVDASFWSGGLISSVFGYPDDVMRDHRKIAFRDVRADDPYRGVGILTGMGVGDQYLGPGWDDRSLVIQGPVLQQLRSAARELLLSQGLVEAELPEPFRSGRPGVATTRLPADATRYDARAMALVNGTGYLPKPLNVAKAVLYSLMPPGSVIKIPDSLWNSTFYGGLLLGACLRGAEVLVIGPALANAPSGGFPQMSRAHELLERLLLARRVLAPALAAAGGDLRIGLYALPVDEKGFESRVDRWTSAIRTTPFLQTLLPFAAALTADSTALVIAQTGTPEDPTAPPKLHQKVQFLATRELWQGMVASPEWPRLMGTYIRYRAATYARSTRDTAARALPDSLEMIAERVLAPLRHNSRAASFALVGSQNQDYRGMFMDGEIDLLCTGPESIVPLVDLVFMVGTVTWIDDAAALDRLVHPPSELQRRLARAMKDGI